MNITLPQPGSQNYDYTLNFRLSQILLEINNKLEQVYSYTYTPTLANVTNVASSTAYACQFIRVQDCIIVSGKVTIDPTAVGTTQLGISLPVASAFANDYECAGTAHGGTVMEGAAILADTTNDRAELKYTATDITSHVVHFTFMYQVK